MTLKILLIISFVAFSRTGIAFGQPQMGQDLFSVSFPTESKGWVCGRWGKILHTADGAATWSPQVSGTDYTLTSIFFVDERTGWAVGDGGTIIHTADGGRVWVQQESPVDFFHMGVFFANTQEGWVVTERTHILYTEDAGRHWSVQFFKGDFSLKAVSFCDENTGWAVGEYGYIYHTKDGGRHWEEQAGSFGISEYTGDPYGGNSLFDVVAFSPSTAWVVGIEGYLARTVDGGSTWKELKGRLPKVHLFGIAAIGQGLFSIVGNGLVMYSVNGGEFFHSASVQPSVEYGWLYGIAAKGESGFAAVGKQGSIYLSDREGATWMRAKHP